MQSVFTYQGVTSAAWINPEACSLPANCKHGLQWLTVVVSQQQDCANPQRAGIPDKMLGAVCSPVHPDAAWWHTSHPFLHISSVAGQTGVHYSLLAWSRLQKQIAFCCNDPLKKVWKTMVELWAQDGLNIKQLSASNPHHIWCFFFLNEHARVWNVFVDRDNVSVNLKCSALSLSPNFFTVSATKNKFIDSKSHSMLLTPDSYYPLCDPFYSSLSDSNTVNWTLRGFTIFTRMCCFLLFPIFEIVVFLISETIVAMNDYVLFVNAYLMHLTFYFSHLVAPMCLQLSPSMFV